jgi:hypothetical protein
MYKAHASTCNNGKGGCALAPSSKNKEEKSQQKKQGVPLSKSPLPPKEKKTPDETRKPKEPSETHSKALKPKTKKAHLVEPKDKETEKEEHAETLKDKRKNIQEHKKLTPPISDSNLNPTAQPGFFEKNKTEEEHKENE